MEQLARDWLLDPLALLFLMSLLLVALVSWRSRLRRGRGARRTRGRVAGKVAVAVWITVFLVTSAPAIVNPMLAIAENRHDASRICPASSTVVVLGGGVSAAAGQPEHYAAMSPATLARVAAAERLALADPRVAIVLSGGVPASGVRRVAEADVMAEFLVARGIARERLHAESVSNSTAGNAAEVAGRLPAKSGAVRLVTSALHMPRAVATFERAGVAVCPVAVDRQAVPDVPWWALVPQTTAFVKFDALLHEWLATAVYRWTGRL